MTSHAGHLRSNLYDLPVDARTSRPIAELMGLVPNFPQTGSIHAQTAPIQTPKVLKPKTVSRRARIWELNSHLHCSIIGTCLSAAELRRLLARLNIVRIETADEHELHMLGVLLADRPDEGAKVLQKALDRRHQGALNRFAKAKDDAAIAVLWKNAVAGGDIAGAYWALLTHPNSSDKLVQKAFGDIHMLSHLMGATNCADLHRMRQLEDENAALLAKIERQQRQLRDGFVERDRTIQSLTESLEHKARHAAGPSPDAAEVVTLKAAIADLNSQLAREIGRRERLEQRQHSLEETEAACLRLEEERDALRAELDLIESRIGSSLPAAAVGDAVALDLAGSTVLYVGGRSNQIPQLKALVEQSGGQFLHHDGGIEHSPALLPGLVGRSDVTMFPVDCVSHGAMTSAKRACAQSSKPYVALRTSSLACLLSSLAARYGRGIPEGARR